MRPQDAVNESYARLFQRRVPENRGSLAAASQAKTLTYDALDEQSDNVARRLRSLGVGSETLVGVCLERSVELLVTLLAVGKAGGAFLPLDPGYPKDRLAFMVKDSKAFCLITTEKLRALLPEHIRSFCWDELRRMPGNGEISFPRPHPDDLAYVIFTSGSTGTPKGVEITNRSVTNHSLAISKAYELAHKDRVLQFSSISFDVSIEEIFPSWLAGAAVILRPDEAISSMPAFLNFVADQQISVLNLPTAYWHELVEALHKTALPACVRLVVIGGETASESAYQRWKTVAPSTVKLLNAYGPTETTVTATLFTADHGNTLPIGRPIENVSTQVLNEEQQPVQPGEIGELYIGGAGVARGYRHRPQLTAERFINRTDNGSRERLYRTGDFVRLQSDGNLVFIERRDQQVKIRGFRIELGEVESALKSSPVVRDAVVLAKPNHAGRNQLVGYCVAQNDSPSTISDLKEFLRTKLPDYMVPTVFVLLEAFPLTATGKIDRCALPEPTASPTHAESEFLAPRTELEKQLAQVWQEVLHLYQVSATDNFFDLGGDSLSAMQLISRLREEFKVELPLSTLFDCPTLEALATTLHRAGPHSATSLLYHHAPGNGQAPASFIQENLWFLDQLNPGGNAYVIPAAFELKGPLEVEALDQALNEVIQRHGALRTTFQYSDGQLLQVIAPALHVPISITTLTRLAGQRQRQAWLELVQREVHRPFDLEKGPLIRALLIRLGAQHHIFALVLHHIVSDGWSFGVLFPELETSYSAFAAKAFPTLPPLTAQYVDYAIWQRDLVKGTMLQNELDYWRGTLSGAPEELNFPPNNSPRQPTTPQAAAGRCCVGLGAQAVQAAEQLARHHRATPFMVWSAALAVALHHWTGQKDLIIGTVVAGRTRRQFENLIGCFMNFLPLRIQLRNTDSGEEILRKVRAAVLEAQAHQDCPFEKIVSGLNPRRTANRNPFYNIGFLWQHFPGDGGFKLANLKIKPVSLPPQAPLLDMRLEAEQKHGKWFLSCEYKTELLSERAVTDLLGSFGEALDFLSRTPEAALDSFSRSNATAAFPLKQVWRWLAKSNVGPAS